MNLRSHRICSEQIEEACIAWFLGKLLFQLLHENHLFWPLFFYRCEIVGFVSLSENKVWRSGFRDLEFESCLWRSHHRKAAGHLEKWPQVLKRNCQRKLSFLIQRSGK
ncbi:uncharacterized protein LOC133872437 isoform X1 [Alnus glutinosa]|uniref:uncharacterized protein LOC133872437 isoform X1 n=1 Tax=Alnus glutinosa TaxID=3517 RepID=UPI002D78D353|nr:uncharacterized protein LOC133872437 isoform X1 [Alnus glutinosa]